MFASLIDTLSNLAYTLDFYLAYHGIPEDSILWDCATMGNRTCG